MINYKEITIEPPGSTGVTTYQLYEDYVAAANKQSLVTREISVAKNVVSPAEKPTSWLEKHRNRINPIAAFLSGVALTGAAVLLSSGISADKAPSTDGADNRDGHSAAAPQNIEAPSDAGTNKVRLTPEELRRVDDTVKTGTSRTIDEIMQRHDNRLSPTYSEPKDLDTAADSLLEFGYTDKAGKPHAVKILQSIDLGGKTIVVQTERDGGGDVNYPIGTTAIFTHPDTNASVAEILEPNSESKVVNVTVDKILGAEIGISIEDGVLKPIDPSGRDVKDLGYHDEARTRSLASGILNIIAN